MSQAEAWLRDRGIASDRWPGTQVRYGENTPGGMWASIVYELERRGDEWIVTRLDRNREPLADADCGMAIELGSRAAGTLGS